jgi:hypothetical protein
MNLRIANTQGFWGDRPSATQELLKQDPNIDFLTLDYLAEVSLSIMAIQKNKDPSLGYAKDFVSVIDNLIPFWKNNSKVKVVTNAGGLNPESCAKACKILLQKHNLNHIKIATVSGDDVLSKLQNQPDNFENLDTLESLKTVQNNLVSANAYFGANGIVEALDKGANIIITGRVADPSMVVGPCIHHFKWNLDDYNSIAGATIAGHLIECGSQVLGGISTHWLDIKDPWNIGFPIVEINSNGDSIVTKTKHSSGEVSIRTVKEQLLYEISDPHQYLSPDVTVSFMDLKVEEIEKNRVKVSRAKGKKPTDSYKVSATYKDGYRSEGTLIITGYQAIEKAQRCGEMVYQRLKNLGLKPQRWHVECLGSGDSSILPSPPKKEIYETVLRIAAADQNKKIIEQFTKEIAPLVTSGPQGVTGYTGGRPKIRPIYCFWPCLINKQQAPVICRVHHD